MSKNILEQMEEMGAKTKIATFMAKQKETYEFKKRYAEIRAYEFRQMCDEHEVEPYCSIGGLDSITLYLFLRSIGIKVPGVSVSSLEDKSIQKVHDALMLTKLKPAKDKNGKYYSKVKILNECGFPVLSKEIASKVEKLQKPTEKNKTIRHAIITGETGAYGGFQKHSKMKLANKWLKKFAGYENENEGVNYDIAPFKLSSKCCYYLKEKPCQDWAKKHNAVPYLGLMASEGGRRAKGLMLHGCNYWGKSTIRSAPFAIFDRDDLLHLTLEMDELWKNGWREEFEAEAREKGLLKEGEHFIETIVPKIYGTIKVDKDGKLYTTGAQRTGCNMCGFGIHMEKRPHRFDILRQHNEKEWHFWMYDCVIDPETGEKFGWGKVLDYIGVGWNDMPENINKTLVLPGQIDMFS
ncbi:hypothetical protein FDE85_02645 [Clostridium botulinum]|nr:hypothetical protein [Clostridium botulinum]NFR89925.1 hypothetical protein [Clostridium botulinum]NFT97943.1 hypothetical protein [Clostridium botulinum]